MEGYISRQTAIKRLGCTKEDMNRFLRDGLIDYKRKDGGGYLISEESLKAFSKEHLNEVAIKNDRIQQLEEENRYLRGLLTENGIVIPEMPSSKTQSSQSALGLFALSRRTMAIFRANGIKTVEDLASYSISELKSLKGIGRKTIEELSWFLSLRNLSFKDEL